MKPFPPLPINEILQELKQTIDQNGLAVLQAPPGAGKTTRVPLALLESDWARTGKIVMLEPRRLAARTAARHMASLLGEKVGETVGYQIRLEKKSGPKTKIEVVTEGILTRRLQQDPSLEGISCIIFDEFHERSLQADLGLALCLEAREALRDDLKILVMSATLDGDPIASLLGDAPIITSEGRAFPVETRYLDKPDRFDLVPAIIRATMKAIDEETGSVLVFLPGEGEIKKVETGLLNKNLGQDILVCPLYGTLPPDKQISAIEPAPEGMRKIVLATNIAETSLTIEGIRVVIDSGLMRKPKFDPASAMTRLETVTVSKAAADQRRGRAGRLEEGVCYRLWPKGANGALQPFTRPEIEEADLASLALDLAQWGVSNPETLNWLNPPPKAAYNQARDLLYQLDALDEQGKLTDLGRKMAAFPAHPRLAHMVLKAKLIGLGGLGTALAALLEERDILSFPKDRPNADIRLRLDLFNGDTAPAGARLNKGALIRARKQAQQWSDRFNLGPVTFDSHDAGKVLALAYPDRIGMARNSGKGTFRLSNGRGAQMDQADRLAGASFLVVADLMGASKDSKIFLAAPLDKTELEEIYPDQIRWQRKLEWDAINDRVLACQQRCFASLVLEEKPLTDLTAEDRIKALLEGIRQKGLSALPWDKEASAYRDRLLFVQSHHQGWHKWDEDSLLEDLENWLAPYLEGIGSFKGLKKINMVEILKARLDWEQQQELNTLAPERLSVPSGSSYQIDYSNPKKPVLAVKLQEMFGATETPCLMQGKVPVTLHLLSPAGRPLQVTQDLASFWQSGYAGVKADMKGRYPKHPWPDNPLTAQPQRGVKK